MANDYEHERRGAQSDRPYNRIMPEPSLADGATMDQYLVSRDLNSSIARSNGWYPSRNAGDSYLRVVIPATSTDDNVFWQARLIEGPPDARRYQSPYGPRGNALVLVWQGTGNGIFVVVEGPLDALAAAGEGCVGVGLMGNNPTQAALDHLAKWTKGDNIPVFLVSDADQPEAMVELMKELAARGILAKIRYTAPFKDLAEIPSALRWIMLSKE